MTWTRTQLYQALAAVQSGNIAALGAAPHLITGLQLLALAEEVKWDKDGNLTGSLTPLGNRLLTLLEGVK